MIHALPKEQVSEKTKRLEELEDDLAKNLETAIQKREDYRTTRDEKISTESELKNLIREEHKAQQACNQLDMENKKLNSQINAIQQELKSNDRTVEIIEAMSKRPTFYDALLDRLNRLQNEFIDNGIEFKHPEKFIKELQHDIEKGGISEYLVFIRGAKGRYTEYMESISTNIVDGAAVSPKELMSVNAYLDSFLKHDTVIQRWN